MSKNATVSTETNAALQKILEEGVSKMKNVLDAVNGENGELKERAHGMVVEMEKMRGIVDGSKGMKAKLKKMQEMNEELSGEVRELKAWKSSMGGLKEERDVLKREVEGVKER